MRGARVVRLHARFVVDTSAVIDRQLPLAAERSGHDLLHTIDIKLLELLVVQRRGDRGQGPPDLLIGRHVIAITPSLRTPTGAGSGPDLRGRLARAFVSSAPHGATAVT